MRDGWTRTRIGDIAEVVGGGTPSTKTPEYWGGPIPWITPSEVTAQEGDVIFETERTITPEGLGKSGARLLPPKAVLLTSRATVGAVAMAGVEMATNQGFASLIAGPEAIPEFLAIWCQHNRVEFEIRASGSTFPEISKSLVKDVPVLLPPLVVQRRAVDLVDAVDTYATAAARSSESSSTHLAALCEAVFEVDAPMMAMTDLAVPKGLIGGPFGSSLVAKDYVDEGVPVIRGTNMPKAGCFVGGEFAHVSPEKADQLRRNLAAPGDVVFTQRGTLGQVGLVPAAGPDRYVVSQSQMRLRPNPDLVLGEYVYLVFRSPRMVAEVLGRNTATANPHINLGILAGLEIPVPALAEQAAIVELAWSSMAVAERAEDLRRDVQRLRSALLNELLSGEREIPESYDELVGLVA